MYMYLHVRPVLRAEKVCDVFSQSYICMRARIFIIDSEMHSPSVSYVTQFTRWLCSDWFTRMYYTVYASRVCLRAYILPNTTVIDFAAVILAPKFGV